MMAQAEKPVTASSNCEIASPLTARTMTWTDTQNTWTTAIALTKMLPLLLSWISAVVILGKLVADNEFVFPQPVDIVRS